MPALILHLFAIRFLYYFASYLCCAPMANSRQLRIIATNPRALMRFKASGQLPRGDRPASPLITLLESIGPGLLAQIYGITVDARMGYQGSRTFPFGTQALRWIKPSDEVFGSYPADSWRDRRFTRSLTLQDLIPCCARVPQQLLDRAQRERAVQAPADRSGAAAAQIAAPATPTLENMPMNTTRYLIEVSPDAHRQFLRENESCANSGSTAQFDAARNRTQWIVAGEVVAESEGPLGTQGRYWSVVPLTDAQHDLAVDQLSNNDVSSDDELLQFLFKEGGIPMQLAKVLLVERDRCFTQVFYEPASQRLGG